MEKTVNEEFEDALSFCDLSFEDQEIEINNDYKLEKDQNFLISRQESFEFSTSSSSSSSSETNSDIIFCGKIISTKSDLDDQINPVLLSKNKSKSRSLRCQSIGSRSNSRKHKVMIGLAKIPSKMELSDLRERQSRRTPPPMFPASPAEVGGEASAVVNGNRSSNRKSRWSLLRNFRYRAHCLGSAWLATARPCLD